MADLDDKFKSSSAPAPASVLAHWGEHKQRWAALEQAVANRQLKPAERTALHTQVIGGLLAINEEVLDGYGMSLDPVLETCFLVQAAGVFAPELAQKLGQMRARGTGFLATGKFPVESRGPFIAVHSQASERFAKLGSYLGKASVANPELKAALAAKADALHAQIVKTLALADQQLINAAELKLPSNEYFQNLTDTINAVYEFNAVALDHLDKTLDARARDVTAAAALRWWPVKCAVRRSAVPKRPRRSGASSAPASSGSSKAPCWSIRRARRWPKLSTPYSA